MPAPHPALNKTAALLAMAILLFANPALAHKIKIFAMVEGTEVTGYAYAPGGVRLPNDKVEIFDGNKQKLAEVQTDGNGEFSFHPKKRSDLHFEMDTGDGHRTSFLIQAGDLPESLPTDGTVASQILTPPQPTAIKPLAASNSQDELAALIDVTVARNIRPLREQLEAYEEKVRFHDILGGIGYILGLAGIAAYLLAGRKEKENISK